MYKNVELIVNGRLIRGSVRTPEGEGPFKTVIFLHGFNVDRSGFARLHEMFARECLGRGYATIKFDFYGLGESEGDFSEMTIGKEMEETRAIYEWAKTQPEVDKDNIILGGQSMGAGAQFDRISSPECQDRRNSRRYHRGRGRRISSVP